MISIRTWALRTLIAGTVLLASCGFKKTDGGVEYKIIESKDGRKVEAGGQVHLNFRYYNEADTFSSEKTLKKKFVEIPLPDSITNQYSIEAVLTTLSEGDSVVLRISSDSLYKGGQMPKGLDEDSKTTFEIRIVKVITKDSLRKMQDTQRAEMMRKMQSQPQDDSLAIEKYLAEKNIKAKRTPEGIYYTIEQKANGKTLKAGETANTIYTGRLLDGTTFDSNEGREPFPVVIDQSQVIMGWHIALKQLKKGEKGTFYIPSHLGYGPRGAEGVIPPFAVLVFDIEVAK